MLDVISICLGLLSWWIPLGAMRKKNLQRGYLYVVMSLGACAVSMQFQIMQILFALSQGATEMGDTFDRVILACGILIAGTFFFLGVSIFVKNRHDITETGGKKVESPKKEGIPQEVEKKDISTKKKKNK